MDPPVRPVCVYVTKRWRERNQCKTKDRTVTCSSSSLSSFFLFLFFCLWLEFTDKKTKHWNQWNKQREECSWCSWFMRPEKRLSRSLTFWMSSHKNAWSWCTILSWIIVMTVICENDTQLWIPEWLVTCSTVSKYFFHIHTNNLTIFKWIWRWCSSPGQYTAW